MPGRLLCWLGRHCYAYRHLQWYGHLVGRCRRCGRINLPEAG